MIVRNRNTKVKLGFSPTLSHGVNVHTLGGEVFESHYNNPIFAMKVLEAFAIGV